ncbi:MAG: patatin [Proteobacteria bacterium]|nr:patatin [Pseudomonadota bacterium]
MLAGLTPGLISDAMLLASHTFFPNPGTDPNRPAYDIDRMAHSYRLLHPFNHPLKKLDRSVLFTSFNVGASGTNGSWTPLLLHNLPNSTTAETPIVDAVVSSGAMPGMFGSWKGNVDGAFAHHDPTLAAIAVAVGNGINLTDITAICIGTGFMPNSIASDTSNWGANQWVNGDDKTKHTIPPLYINAKPSPLQYMAINGTSTSLVPELCAQLLGSRYVYLNPTLPKYIPENANPVNFPGDIDLLEAAAAGCDLTAAQQLVSQYWN